MTDKPFAAHRDRFAAWQASQSPDLAQAEARIDALLATMFEYSRILGDQDGEIVYLKAIVLHQIAAIERQARTIIARDAEIVRLRTDPARTPTERRVSRLQPWYGFERMEEPS